MKAGRIYNFGSGPAVLPLRVLERVQKDMLNYEKSGMSIMEIGHRTKIFDRVLQAAEEGVRRELKVPDDYAVLFLQGGASLQFAMIPMNLYLSGKPVDVLHTGMWTKKAIKELGLIAEYKIAGTTEKDNFKRLPHGKEVTFNPDASYVHICSNNTIFGTQWQQFPDTGMVPLVADMSSDILSRVIEVSRFGLIFAGAQKNLGIAGLTLVVIRKDLAERASKNIPTMMQYRCHIENGSRYNTPPVFAVYVTGLVMEWISSQGGVHKLEEINQKKATLLYRTIDEGDFYSCPVQKEDRSKMNVVFRIREGDEALEAQFAEASQKAGLDGLKGHRSVGGLRASIYNAMPLEGVEALTQFMKDFQKKHG